MVSPQSARRFAAAKAVAAAVAIAVLGVALYTVLASGRWHSDAASLPQSTEQAETAFARFLDLSVATRAPRIGMFDSVYTCEDLEWMIDVRWVADHRIVDVTTIGDTARATAILTTVARQIDLMDNQGTYSSTFRVSADTGHWLMVRSAETQNKWKVCGDARERVGGSPRERFGVFMLGRAIRWQPPGASAEMARAAIDSIRRSRGLPIVR